jgi:hypothetical protein
MTDRSARIVRGILRWLWTLALVGGGTYSALRLPLFERLGIPEGVRLVLSIEFVGLIISWVVETFIARTGLGQMIDTKIWQMLRRPGEEPIPVPIGGD